MKIYLSLTDMKHVQASLYRYRGDIEEDLKKQDPAKSVTEIVEEKLSELSRLILYIDDRIENDK